MFCHTHRERERESVSSACLTKHFEVGLALGVPGGQPVDLAEEFPLVAQLDMLDGESGSLIVSDHLDAAAVVGVVVHNVLTAIAVEDPRSCAVSCGFLRKETRVRA